MGLSVILATLGSSGDVVPFIAMGKAMAARGHSVTLVTNPYFEPAAREAGLDLAPVHTVEDYVRVTANPNLWRPVRGVLVLSREVVLRGIAPVHEAIEDRYEKGRTVVVSTAPTFGARIAHETLGVPLVTVLLQPFCVRSEIDAPAMPLDALARRLGRVGMRGLYRFSDLLIDGIVKRPTNAFRRAHGLPPVSRLMNTWWYSPQCAIGVWPEWFAAPAPDWPACVRLSGFLFHDVAVSHERAKAADAFFSSGDPPIVFTPGTAMRHGRDFFIAAAEACRLLGRRGALVTPHEEQIPDHLPSGVAHVPYVPFGEYLKRAAAIVHHGGIGTVAQSLAAGIPQVIRPTAFDQFDNGERLERLGVGAAIRRGAFRSRRLAGVLDRLLSSGAVGMRCRELAGKVDGEGAMRSTCEMIEQIAATSQD